MVNSDFFPYSNRLVIKYFSEGTWTGYFTTRPWYKRLYQEYSRKVRLLATLAPLQTSTRDISKEGQFYERMDAATWWIGVFIHHDGVTGVSRQHVAENYRVNAISQLKKVTL